MLVLICIRHQPKLVLMGCAPRKTRGPLLSPSTAGKDHSGPGLGATLHMQRRFYSDHKRRYPPQGMRLATLAQVVLRKNPSIDIPGQAIPGLPLVRR
jgi:hypothetical protein